MRPKCIHCRCWRLPLLSKPFGFGGSRLHGRGSVQFSGIGWHQALEDSTKNIGGPYGVTSYSAEESSVGCHVVGATDTRSLGIQQWGTCMWARARVSQGPSIHSESGSQQ